MRLSFEVLRLDAADQTSAPAFCRALQRQMQAQQTSLGLHRSDEGIDNLDCGGCLQRGRAPDAERRQIDIVPAVDIVDGPLY